MMLFVALSRAVKGWAGGRGGFGAPVYYVPRSTTTYNRV